MLCFVVCRKMAYTEALLKILPLATDASTSDALCFWRLVFARLSSHAPNVSTLLHVRRTQSSHPARVTLSPAFLSACLSSLLDRAYKHTNASSMSSPPSLPSNLTTAATAAQKLSSSQIQELFAVFPVSVWHSSTRLISDLLLRASDASSALETAIRLLRLLEADGFLKPSSPSSPLPPSSITPRAVYGQLIHAFAILGHPDAIETVLGFMRRDASTQPGTFWI